MKKIRYRYVYNRKKKLNAQGTALVQIEASLPYRKIYISTRVYVRPEEWDNNTAMIINHPNAMQLNAYIGKLRIKLEQTEMSLWQRGIIPTLLQLKQVSCDDRSVTSSFCQFATSAIKLSQRKPETKRSLLGTLAILANFMPGYDWGDLNYSFLKNLEQYLLAKGSAVNTIAKHLRNVRTLIGEAMSQGYISSDENPFRSFKIHYENRPHRFLNPDELRRMENVRVTGKLAHVRDAFLFCCYTGLRYSDFRLLREDSFLKIKGNMWLHIKTEKTGYDLKIPLHLVFGGKALEILSRYPSVETFSDIRSNAETNRRLRELQQMAKIKTRVTFHTARHTCATLLCHQGVPITTVQRILGHTKLTTTQLYSEVMADTIVKDLKNVKKNYR
ncbi:MAG: site-specific integrase [Bacteroidaceae bacterium]|nr:site-specific integrase [Bacteroidaceae bacterium]